MKELCRVEIPQHIRKIQLSASQRAIYFEWNGVCIKAKRTNIPQKFFLKGVKRDKFPKIEYLKDDYTLGMFKDNKLVGTIRDSSLLPNIANLLESKIKYRLCLKNGEPILANLKTVNTPRMYVIKGQDIYSGNLREHMRGTVMDAIKTCYTPFVKNIPVICEYPVCIACEIHDTIKNYYDNSKSNIELGQAWDIDNYAYPYMKAFPDLLQALGKIKNDDRLHLTQPPVPIFCPIENHSLRKLVFIIYKDDRDIIKNNKIYQDFHKALETDLSLLKDDLFK